jgi:hypothetical protein
MERHEKPSPPFYSDHDSILTSQALIDRYLMIHEAFDR